MRQKSQLHWAFTAVCVLALSTGFALNEGFAQTVPTEGIQERDARVHALIGARVIVEPGQVIEDATIVMKDGVIQSVGAGGPPRGVPTHDVTGLTVTVRFAVAVASSLSVTVS